MQLFEVMQHCRQHFRRPHFWFLFRTPALTGLGFHSFSCHFYTNNGQCVRQRQFLSLFLLHRFQGFNDPLIFLFMLKIRPATDLKPHSFSWCRDKFSRIYRQRIRSFLTNSEFIFWHQTDESHLGLHEAEALSWNSKQVCFIWDLSYFFRRSQLGLQSSVLRPYKIVSGYQHLGGTWVKRSSSSKRTRFESVTTVKMWRLLYVHK